MKLTTEHERLVRKLQSIGELTEAEIGAIAQLPLDLQSVRQDSDIAREGDTPTHCCLIIEGMVCRYKLLGRGQRQIMSFHTAGDVLDLQSLHLKVLDHSLGTIMPVVAAFIPHDALRRLIAQHPNIGGLLWRDTLIDGAIFREWLVGIGRRSAGSRIAHLLCELFVRAHAVGLTKDNTVELPITQAELGDALGLSTVHVNRVLQELRAEGLIVSRGRTLVITDWAGLRRAAEFDPGYLHLRTAA